MSNIYEWLNIEKNRFYRIVIEKDGANDIILNHKWGSCNSNRGGKKNISVQTEAEMQDFIKKMLKRRKVRGYELITKH